MTTAFRIAIEQSGGFPFQVLMRPRPHWRRAQGKAMLTRLHVKGYKSLIDAEVALEPLTLPFWPNAAGKGVRRKQLAVSCGLVRLGRCAEGFPRAY